MKVKFKEESQWLEVKGIGRVDRHNLTDELHEQLLKISPSFAKYFTTEEKKNEPQAKKETVSNPRVGSDKA